MSRIGKLLVLCISILIFAGFTESSGRAQDIVKVVLKQSAIDLRGDYKFSLIKLILEESRDRYGPYEFRFNPPITRNRALLEMFYGDKINLYTAPADREWEAKTIPIRIPIRKGLLNFRILLINKDKKSEFAKVKLNADLQKFQVGLRTGWTTTKVMRALKFDIVTSPTYDGLFKMLDRHRFDFIPRGINEVFGEYEVRSKTHKNILIEPHLLMSMPMPVYLYVAPESRRLAERIRYGFNKIRNNGKFDALFNKTYSKSIARAKLAERKVLRVGNPLLSKQTPLNDDTLWFFPLRSN